MSFFSLKITFTKGPLLFFFLETLWIIFTLISVLVKSIVDEPGGVKEFIT